MGAFGRWTTAIPRRVNYGLSDLRGDVLGGVTTGGIILPVAMGYGVLSGLGAAAGLYGAVAVGIFASVFGGTRGIVYGPNIPVAVAMSVVVAEYADSLTQAATIGILAGLIQMIFGLLGLGRYASYIPSSLISGFFAAFGTLIIVKQVFFALGGSPPPGSIIENITTWPEAVRSVNFEALALTAICIGVLLLWRGRLLRFSPAPFVALVVGIVCRVAVPYGCTHRRRDSPRPAQSSAVGHIAGFLPACAATGPSSWPCSAPSPPSSSPCGWMQSPAPSTSRTGRCLPRAWATSPRG